MNMGGRAYPDNKMAFERKLFAHLLANVQFLL